MSLSITAYHEFLRRKVALAGSAGLACVTGEVNPILKPHQRDIVCWAVRGGRRGIFTRFGLGKTMIQIEVIRLILSKCGGNGLIVMPLGVRQEFKHDAQMLGTAVTFIRSNAEIAEPGIYLTNYESVRDGKLDASGFTAVSLDEAAVLRGFGGTKTFREFMRLFEGTATYRFVATATPSPNEYIELLAYAAFLDIMDVGQAKTRFFKRNAEKADELTIHPHKQREFWLWVASWAIFLQKPSDLGYSDEGYELPELEVRWHEIPTDHSSGAGSERDGQGRLIKNAALGVQEAAREKRDSLDLRIAKLLELRAEDPGAHRLIWHDLEAERHAIETAVPEAVTIYGNQDLDRREQAVIDFSEGRTQELAAKPVLAGSGCNFQRYCAWAIFLGIGFKFAEFIQAVHRIHRFLQTKRPRIDLIYTESEREVRHVLESKWSQHNMLVEQMGEIIREYGLAEAAMHGELARGVGVERREESGDGWRLVLNDSVEETATVEADSLDLILTSIPFSTQYEYTPSFNDFGHNDSNATFFEQMDFLTPELYRALKPGRVIVIHVKDRIVPGGITGLGFQTVYPMHAECIAHCQRHGFAYMGMKTIVTDVVRENNQTYRLGWTEQCKDATKMGWGMPEYLLLFRKPPSDHSNGYGDFPVVKRKREWKRDHWNGDGYSRARWQLDAHAFTRSSGNRLLDPAEIRGLTHQQIYRMHREHQLGHVYDFEEHVSVAEALESVGKLPKKFMLLPPHSDHPDVWTDVARMRTLNGTQAQRNKQMHLCPLQFDIVDRIIMQYSQPGELVFDPFAGLGTVPMCAVQLGRRGFGVELNESYWQDSLYYLRQASTKAPTFFDLLGSEAEP